MPVLQNTLAACDDLFSLSGCGLMIEDAEGGLQFVAATNEVSMALERAQVDSQEGPCIDAFVEMTEVETEDLSVDARWPGLARLAEPLNVHGVLGCPVFVDGISVGSLDVYLDEPHQWDESERRAIRRYADVVGSSLASAMQLRDMSDVVDQLQRALGSRVVIERAVGYLMAREKVQATDAFERLRATARNQRRKVRDVAAEVLRGNQ
jgi:GAF domain-containing protein